jgi:class 3 adenylate cyclase
LIGALRKAREQLPGDPAFGDPLSVSGPGGARAVARAADKLVGDTPGAAREIGFGALQVWQAMLERVGRGNGSQEVTVMFTDLVAFSSWSLSAGDEATLELLRVVATAIEPPIADGGGHVVKRMGDGVMAVFTSADRAMRAAAHAKRNLAEVEVRGYRPQMRVGLHTGSPCEIGGDWLGVDVTIAARVMGGGRQRQHHAVGGDAAVAAARDAGRTGLRGQAVSTQLLRGPAERCSGGSTDLQVVGELNRLTQPGDRPRRREYGARAQGDRERAEGFPGGVGAADQESGKSKQDDHTDVGRHSAHSALFDLLLFGRWKASES